MTQSGTTHYCTNCGQGMARHDGFCHECGWPTQPTPKERARQVAAVLNELGASPMRDTLAPRAHAGLEAHYLRELETLAPPRTAARKAQVSVAAAAASRPQPAPRRPPAPRDWGWLADQQANLLLFAGAFLTIVAALIYVGYSEQAVSGALKAVLLAVYTLAFVAAGVACLRVARVRMAGHVFLGVGAVLLPLNFVLAREFFGEGDLSAESMWLAGSVTSAVFYAALARIGLGRGYAVASGAGVMSASLAAAAAFDVTAEWAPLLFIATAGLLLAPLLVGDELTRARIGNVWQFHAHIAALGAIVWAMGVAVFASNDDWISVSTSWFLPVAFVAFAAFGAAPMLRTRRPEFGVEAALGAAAAILAVLYPFDAPAEGYAVAFGGIAVAFGAARIAARRDDVAARLPASAQQFLYAAGIGATGVAALVSLLVLQAALDEMSAYEPATPWFLAITSALVMAFYAIDAFIARARAGLAGMLASAGALLPSVAYGFDVHAEYYSYFYLVPALMLMAYVSYAPENAVTARLGGTWRDDATWAGRAAAAAGVMIAACAAWATTTPDATFAVEYTQFLPLALLVGAAVFALDAMRQPRRETTAAFLALCVATIASAPYVYDGDASHYGAALAVAGITIAALRALRLNWIDTAVRDGIALVTLALATVPFEVAYLDEPRIGAAVHLATAVVLALAAIRIASREKTSRMRLAFSGDAVLLYAAGLALAFGYFFALNQLPASEDAEAGSLALPFAAFAIALAATGAAMRRLLPSPRPHVYVMSLIATIVAASMSADAGTLAALVTVFAAVYAAIAIYENEPIVGVPSVLLAFAAVFAWREHYDAPAEWLPIAFAALGVAAYATAVLIRTSFGEWSRALRLAGAAYAIAAPLTGFVALAFDQNAADASRYPSTSLYQWSTLAVAVAGGIALAEAALSGRRWVVVPASGVLLLAVLLQVGRIDPENVQAYTLLIGAYLAALGAIGFSRMRLISGGESAGTYIEALGAATIMFPSFVQSFEGGWTYQLILFFEAIAFVALSVIFRRQGMLAAALGALVLVGGRAMFDTVNALPNWIVAMLGGALLLGAGMGLLVARDRWTHWQETLLGWWEAEMKEHRLNGDVT